MSKKHSAIPEAKVKNSFLTNSDGIFQRRLLPVIALIVFIGALATGIWHRNVYLTWIVKQYYISLVLMFAEFAVMGLLLWLSKPQFKKNFVGFLLSVALGALSFAPFELFMVIINVVMFKQSAPSEAVHIGLAYGFISGVIILIFTLCRKARVTVKSAAFSLSGSVVAAVPLGIFLKKCVPIILAAIVAFGQNIAHKDIVVDSLNEGWCISNNGYASSGKDVERLISVVPSPAQLAHSKLEYYNMIHFGMNTFTGNEWGNGKETVEMFTATKVDTDQWCRVLKESGSKGIIFTAKHHDGFCMWATKATDFNVMNSSYGKDVLAQLAKSCEKYGMKLGIYLSPWDMHEPRYGSGKGYDDFFVEQLTELCTNYGEIFEFWFDGAYDKSITPKSQNYDWQRYFDLIYSLQPDTVIAEMGSDIRWNGSEFGAWREKGEWSVYPFSNTSLSTGEPLWEVTLMDEDTGSRDIVSDRGDLKWYPAESNFSITSGWFYHDNGFYSSWSVGVKTPQEIAEAYFAAVGGNASFLLNVGPDKNGEISERECNTLKKFREIVDGTFANKIDGVTAGALTKSGETRTGGNYSALFTSGRMLADDEYAVSLKLPGKKEVTAIVLREDIKHSQRVEQYKIYAKSSDGYVLLSSGYTIGSKCIVQVDYPVRSDEIIIEITQSRSNPVIGGIELYE